MSKTKIPQPKAMPGMLPMLAYTIQSSIDSGSGDAPFVVVGLGTDQVSFTPQNPTDDSYWILILDAMNPRNKVKEFMVPGSQNSQVPAGLDNYMSNPQYIFALATQYLSMMNVPQGDFYDYLVKYGAGRELQRMEQINSVLSCGTYERLCYIFTGQCGPRDIDPKTQIKPVFPTYEQSSTSDSALMMMSLMPRGQDEMGNPIPPYSVCDSYTFKTRW